MGMKFSSQMFALSCLLLVIVGGLTGCSSNPDGLSITPMDINAPVFVTTAPVIKTPIPTTTPQHTPTRSRTPSPTASSTAIVRPTATNTPITPGSVSKDLLILVQEKSLDSIAVLPAGETTPHILLREPGYSLKYPQWSRDGNWVSFIRHDLRNRVDRLGIIRKEGEEEKIFSEEFGVIGWPYWSADDQMLVFEVLRSSSFMPFAMNIESEEIVELLPDYDGHFSNTRLEPSPKDMQAAFIGFSEDLPLKVEVWLLALDGSNQENIPLPENEAVRYCTNGISARPLAWSPDGQTFLVQFKNQFENECRSQLWLYSLAEKKWSNIVSSPQGYSTVFFDKKGRVHWSVDGRWVSWATDSRVIIYDVKDEWKMVREIQLQGSESLGVFPWFVDDIGNSIFFVRRNLSVLGVKQDVMGISPNGIENEDRVILQIGNDPVWVPRGTFVTAWMWQP